MKELTIQAGSDSFTFYDNSEDTLLRSFDGFEYPTTIRSSIEDVSGNKNAYYVASYFGRRTISFIGDIIGDNIFTLRRSLLDVLNLNSTLKTLKFTTYDDLELQMEVELSKYNNPYNHKVHTFNIEMIASDYRLYSQTLYEYNTSPNVVRGGFSIPITVPIAFETRVTETNILVNNGTEKTNPIFTIYGPGTQFRIINQDNDKEFTIVNTLLEDEYIEVDTKEETVKLNTGESIYTDFTGDFIDLEVGNNHLWFSVLNSTESTALKVEWRDAYNGL
jgi:hypothetical protein